MEKRQRILLSLLSGLLLTIAWPVWGYPIFIFFAFVPLLMIEDDLCQTGNGHFFWIVFLSLFLWNTATTWWVWNATPAAIIAWLTNALLMTIVFMLFHATKKRLCNNIWGNFFLIPYWMAFELLTYHWIAKWPWLNLGNVFSTCHQWVQWYEYTGIAGGTLWVLLVNILISNFIITRKDSQKKESYCHLAVALALIIAPIVYSLVVYHNYEEQGEDTEIIVVQQNCDPWNEQFDSDFYRNTIQRNISLAESLVTPNTKFIVSSESAIQEGIWWDDTDASWSIQAIREFLKKHPQSCYVIGATTHEWVPEGMEDDFPARRVGTTDNYYYTHNSALLIDTASIQHRNKSQLTPGVEAVPEWKFLKESSVTIGIARGTLKTDSTSHNMSFAGHEIGAAICYESAFNEYVGSFTKKGADLLFVMTNDGWWGDTPGYKQHFEFSKLRAIENRRCIARSANTGRSGFFNQRGDVMQPTKYWEPAAIRETLKANTKVTFYAQHGDYLSRIALFCAIISALCLIIKAVFDRIRRKQSNG